MYWFCLCSAPFYSTDNRGCGASEQGHLEFFLCDVGDLEDGEEKVVPQSCFNKYPLNRADDDVANSPIDANFPGRYYVDPECRGEERSEELPENAPDGYMIRMNYLLPENVTCKRCILQMVYCECSQENTKNGVG